MSALRSGFDAGLSFADELPRRVDAFADHTGFPVDLDLAHNVGGRAVLVAIDVHVGAFVRRGPVGGPDGSSGFTFSACSMTHARDSAPPARQNGNAKPSLDIVLNLSGRDDVRSVRPQSRSLAPDR